MKSLTGIVRDGQIVTDGRVDWPNGTAVEINPQPAAGEKYGIDESQWRDDAASLADWNAWLATIEPLEISPEEALSIANFRAATRQQSLADVKRQMEEWMP